jgi:3-hydroxymyristoyl/3-hydroxydecanoyl-(acyl carrier protein) dehydratase
MMETESEVLWPEVFEETMGADEATLALRIPENLAYFDGHFPKVPIVPGVVQIHWAVHFARGRFELPPAFRNLEAIKFKDLILPCRRLHLYLRYAPPAGRLSFIYRMADREYSSGRIHFHGNPV